MIRIHIDHSRRETKLIRKTQKHIGKHTQSKEIMTKCGEACGITGKAFKGIDNCKKAEKITRRHEKSMENIQKSITGHNHRERSLEFMKTISQEKRNQCRKTQTHTQENIGKHRKSPEIMRNSESVKNREAWGIIGKASESTEK